MKNLVRMFCGFAEVPDWELCGDKRREMRVLRDRTGFMSGQDLRREWFRFSPNLHYTTVQYYYCES